VKTRSLILVGVLVFVWNLLVNAPAASAYAWLAPNAAPLRLFGLEGSFDRGEAQALQLNGHTLMQNLRWSFQPWWLPLARLSFHVEGGNADLSLKGRVARVYGGFNLAGVQGSGSVKALAAASGFPFLPVDGLARVDLDRLALRRGLPRSAGGTIELHGMAFTLGKDPVALGDFKATVSTESPPAGGSSDSRIKVAIESLGGPLDASGELHLQPEGGYDYDLQFKPRDNADPALRNLLQGAGAPDAQGYYHLRNRGVLSN
jgi:hypothetical protein